MFRYVFPVVLCIAIYSGSFAQQNNTGRCNTSGYTQRKIAKNPSLLQKKAELDRYILDASFLTKKTTIITVPIVIHVLYYSPLENISDERILEQIRVLTQDFSRMNTDTDETPAPFRSVASDMGIRFCLATKDPYGNSTTGIIRKYTPVSSFYDDDQMKFASSAGDDAWPSDSYLNIWVCNMADNQLGYAQFPWDDMAATDGVVLDYTVIGGPLASAISSLYNSGRTATHEVGHWLGLYHIWGDEECGDDLVDDTPVQYDANYKCRTFPYVTCNNDPYGDMYMNYMDYTPDKCMNLFTNGQTVRCRLLFEPGAPRNSMLNSMACANETDIEKTAEDTMQQQVQVFPNPAKNTLTLNIMSPLASLAQVYILDMTGREVLVSAQKLYTGSNSCVVDLQGIAVNGLYEIRVVVSTGCFSKKILISK